MKTYNINSVSKITGLTAFVIRAWEKRYNVVVPQRTETNRRLYSEEDIERLKLLKEAVDRGSNIGNVASLGTEELKQMLLQFRESPAPESSPGNVSPEAYFEKCLQAVRDFDHRMLESTLIRASIEFSLPLLIDQLVLPLLKKIGEYWHQGTFRIAQEHMASAVIRTFLYNLKDSYKPAGYNARILVTTPYGQNHEFGALISALVAAAEGWDAVYIGPDLPSSEIISAAERLKPKIVAISIIFVTEDMALVKEIEKLKYLPESVKLVAGGRGAYSYKEAIETANGIIMENYEDFRRILKSVV